MKRWSWPSLWQRNIGQVYKWGAGIGEYRGRPRISWLKGKSGNCFNKIKAMVVEQLGVEEKDVVPRPALLRT